MKIIIHKSSPYVDVSGKKYYIFQFILKNRLKQTRIKRIYNIIKDAAFHSCFYLVIYIVYKLSLYDSLITLRIQNAFCVYMFIENADECLLGP